LPANAVWDYYCLQQDVPVGIAFMDVIKQYEREELTGRSA
jgi:L-rhamnose isomerase